MRKLNSGGHAEVFRITGARQGLAADVRGRQRRYVISMGIRTVAVILAATLWNVSRPVAVVALVLGAALPYVAVVIANAGRENAPSLPSTFVSAPMRPMIASQQEEGTSRPGEATHDKGAAESIPKDVQAESAAGVRSETHERT
ncbi:MULTISPECIES: DUF3099 domain-containing protein [unclassified Streptomyces]|uniref:DUF3099 domain-containing protein n=1 Tax=unclassified Streptomyces TaxID=2593676 RepID=UPI003D941046